MTKHVLMSLLMVVAVAGSIQAQGLSGRALQMDKNKEGLAAENRLWNSWPRRSSDSFSDCPDDIRAQAERKFNCVVMTTWPNCSTNSWRVGQGTSCIIVQYTGYSWDLLQKIDASGKIVGISRSDAIDYDIFEELKWIDDQMSKRIDELQEKWAKEHNMTVDEAKEKYAKWEERHREERYSMLSRMNQRAEKQAKQQRDAKDAAEK